MALQIRPARPEEYDEIGALVVRAFATIDGFDPDTTDYTDELADVAGRSWSCEIYVATLPDDPSGGERIVGAVTYVPGPGPYAEFDETDGAGLRMLAVEPAYSGRGIGTALTEVCLDRAVEQGRRLLVLHTSSENTAAQALYPRLGFRRVPQRDLHVDGLWLKGYEWRAGGESTAPSGAPPRSDVRRSPNAAT